MKKHLLSIAFTFIFAASVFSQSLVCIEVPFGGRVADPSGRGVSTTVYLRALNGSPDLILRSNSFGFFSTASAISCELYEVRAVNRKYTFAPEAIVANPYEMPFVSLTAYEN